MALPHTHLRQRPSGSPCLSPCQAVTRLPPRCWLLVSVQEAEWRVRVSPPPTVMCSHCPQWRPRGERSLCPSQPGWCAEGNSYLQGNLDSHLPWQHGVALPPSDWCESRLAKMEHLNKMEGLRTQYPICPRCNRHFSSYWGQRKSDWMRRGRCWHWEDRAAGVSKGTQSRHGSASVNSHKHTWNK